MFKVGQKVVCIDDSKGIGTGHKDLVKDEVYTISKPLISITGESIVFLFEVPIRFKNGMNFGWSAHRFRPIDYSFGEKLAEEIQEEINQEQLVNA